MQLLHEPLHFNLEKPFKTAKRTVSSTFRQELIKLEWNGTTGYGLVIFNNDNSESNDLINSIIAKCNPILSESDPFSIRKTIDKLDSVIPEYPNFIMGIDMALYDLLGKTSNLPLHKLLGLNGYKIPKTLFSIPNSDISEVMKNVEKVKDWPIIKFKMNKLEKEVIKETRAVYDGMLWIDGNGTWNEELLKDSIEFLEKYNVSVLEQPLPIGEYKKMAAVKKHSKLIFIVDEDTVNFKKIVDMADYVDGVNIKLPRIGGITHALDAIICAKNLGLKVILGCEIGSTLHTTATAQLAGLADYIDVDGHLYLLDDIFSGINVQKGVVTVPNAPGLGCTLL